MEVFRVYSILTLMRTTVPMDKDSVGNQRYGHKRSVTVSLNGCRTWKKIWPFTLLVKVSPGPFLMLNQLPRSHAPNSNQKSSHVLSISTAHPHHAEMYKFHDGCNIHLLLDEIPLPDIIGMLRSFDVRDGK